MTPNEAADTLIDMWMIADPRQKRWMLADLHKSWKSPKTYMLVIGWNVNNPRYRIPL